MSRRERDGTGNDRRKRGDAQHAEQPDRLELAGTRCGRRRTGDLSDTE
jgi:hypothetical protein